MIYWLSYFVLKFLMLVYFRGHAKGRENFPARQPFIGVINHNSLLDVAAATLVIRFRATTMAKHTLFQIPILKWWLRAMGIFPVIRDGSDEEAFQRALAVLREGGVLIIAAEGTRRRHEVAPRPRTGFVRLAQMVRCPVVPIAFYGTHKAMPPGAFFPRPLRISAMVGKPIWLPPVECTPENRPLLQEQANMVMSKVYEMVTTMESRAHARRAGRQLGKLTAQRPAGSGGPA